MSRFVKVVCVVFVICSAPIFAQSPVNIDVNPAFDIPLGETTQNFSFGGSVALRGSYTPAALPLFSFLGELGFGYHPYSDTEFLPLLTGSGGISLNIRLGDKLLIKGYGAGGYGYGKMVIGGGEQAGYGPYVTAGGDVSFMLAPWLSVGVGGAYKLWSGVYSGVGIRIGTSLHLGGNEQTTGRSPRSVAPAPLITTAVEGGPMQVKNVEFGNIFPVFYTYYEENPFGTVTLANPSESTISDVKVSFYVDEFMSTPMVTAQIDELAAGAESSVGLTALFTSKMLEEVTQGTKVAAQIMVEYAVGEQKYTTEAVETMPVQIRNGMTWDDDRRAAAFVTERDPRVQTLSKSVAGMVNTGAVSSVPAELRTAIAFHETILLHGMSYVVDPTSSYIELSQNSSVIDTLQFPRETLSFRAGDCDDLAILYCAMFESVDIETAFITIPGHIYMAFALKMSEDEARDYFLRSDELIFREGKAWIPIEVTALEVNFLDAWQQGAKQWRENVSKDQAGFFPVRDAWKLYRQVALPGQGDQINFPARDDIAEAFQSQYEKFVEREIYPKVADLRGKISSSNNSAKYLNRLGVLYARYGLTTKAVTEFQKAIATTEYVPSLMNIGNIYYLDKDMDSAKKYYEQALSKAPENPKVLLSAARVNHELENYGTVREMYAKLKNLDNDLAERYAYLDLRGEEAARAAEITGLRNAVLWDEEEE